MTQLRTDGVHCLESAGTEPVNLKVVPMVTMVQLICASLSHTHYWYELGMLKVSVEYRIDTVLMLEVIPRAREQHSRAAQ